MKRILAVAAIAMLSGCMGTVETTRLDRRYQPDTAAIGVSYALPMLQYDISITHTLTSCTTPGSADKGAAAGVGSDDRAASKPKDATSLTFDTKVESTAKYVPGERFNVDYRKLSGLFRTSSFSIEYYPNGTIKSVGAVADDKTGDAIKSAAKLAGGVIALTTGTPTLKGILGVDQDGSKLLSFQPSNDGSGDRFTTAPKRPKRWSRTS